LVDMQKQKAHYLNPSKDPWDVLGDEFEPNVSAVQITQFFNPLKKGLVKLIDRYNVALHDCDDLPNVTLLDFPASIEDQKRMTQIQVDFLHMDPTRFRVDVSVHPFTNGRGDDVRCTTHYLEGQPMAAFYSTLHECGHAIYDLNLPLELRGMLSGEPISAGIHESQSRYIENLVGKNPAFLRYIRPKLLEIYNPLRVATESQLIRAINAIVPSKIRIYADEVTYSLHIILRFEIERDLFADRITVNELPQVWNEKMEAYLQQTIEQDAEGVLQDVHWYGGMFGYFPDYALGNLYNAQMLEIMRHAIPYWEEQIRIGNVLPIRDWLISNVHQKGNIMDPLPFIQSLTGESLNPHYFLDYIEVKYGSIFNF
jgi:carboxypeptidase Taq